MNDFINLSAVENSPEISTALSSSKTGDNSQSAKDKAVVVHVFFSQNKNIEDLQEFQLLAESANVEILQSSPQAERHHKQNILSVRGKHKKSLMQ